MNVKVNQSQKVNPPSMEVFLNPTPSLNKTNLQVENPKEIKNETQKEQPKKEEIKIKEEKNNIKIEEKLEQTLKQLEQELGNVKQLDLTTFNNIVFTKKLSFKLLFIKSKIYVVVRDTNGRSAIVSIKPPKFGGSSLRYLVSQCNDWCIVVNKNTKKGEILSYQTLNNSNEELDNDDIFD